ncbi:MAG: response regulator [Anaerolineae bacterium]|nr:response regulator [Anaerolineae bacterium]
MKKFSWRSWPLALKLTVTITFIVVLVVTAVTLISIRRERQNFQAELEQQAELLLNTLAAGAADSLYFLDADFLNDMMVDLGKYKVVTFGRIYDDEGRIVADALDPDQRFNISPDPFGTQVLASSSTRYDWESEQLIAGKSVMLGSQTVGAIAVGLPTAPLAAKIQTVRDQGVVVANVAVLVGLILALLFSRSITDPLQDMVNATQRVSEGDLSQPVEIRSGDELATLGEHFNLMTARLQFTMNQMEGEIEERKRTQVALEAAKEEAESANRAKSTFLANMSHELRTPLNAILGYSQLMTRSQEVSPQVRENLQVISRSGEHLLGLINQVLDMSKIEAGRMTINEREFDLYSLLTDIEGMFRLKAQEKEIRLIFERHPETPRYIRTDEMKLRQILINLLNNAFKFTDAGYVMLRVDYTQETAVSPQSEPIHKLLFAVEDTGPGIAPEELDTMFEAFVQAEAGRQSGGGTGLGLTLSRQFAQLLGGEMTARNMQDKQGHGALFQFNIQIGVIDTISHIKKVSPEVIALKPNQPEFRILVTDDIAESRQILVQLLRPLGFQMMEAKDGQEALDFWQSWQPHLIWMDLHMPNMNGCTATELIKTAETDTDTIVVATTASAFAEELGDIMDCGFDDFVRKPIRTEEVFEILTRHLGVEYVYAVAETAVTTPSSSGKAEDQWKTAVASLPESLQNNLKNAALQTNMTEMDHLITQTSQYQPTLAQEFQQLADDFEYGKILDILHTNH